MTDTVQALKDRLSGKAPPADPRKMPVHVSKLAKVSVKELKAAILANPDHPTSVDYAKGVSELSDEQVLSVEEVDLLALLENREVIRFKTVDETGRETIRKELGKYLTKSVPAQEVNEPD